MSFDEQEEIMRRFNATLEVQDQQNTADAITGCAEGLKGCGCAMAMLPVVIVLLFIAFSVLFSIFD